MSVESSILLLHHDHAFATMVTEQLRAAGYETTHCATERDGRSALSRARFAVLLLDVDFSGSGAGIAFAREIIEQHSIPIVFLAEVPDPATIAAMRTVTRYGYVLNRSGIDVLIEVVRLAIGLFSERAALARERDHFQSIATLTGDIIVRHDRDGKWTYLNKHAYEVWGIPRDQPLCELDYRDYVDQADLDQITRALESMRDQRVPVLGLVNRVQTARGERIYQWNSAPIIGPDGSFDGFQSTGRDITSQIESEAQIRELLAERELLMAEIHHRVKNDLNFVYSLLSLHAQSSDHPSAKQTLREASERVGVMVRLYDSLTGRDDRDTARLDALLGEIAERVRDHLVREDTRITVELRTVTLATRAALHIAMVANELLTNAAKYTDTPNGVIALRCYQEASTGEVVLSVGNSGAGFPVHVLNGTSAGFGTALVKTLVMQHGGSVTYTNRSYGETRAHVEVRVRPQKKPGRS